MAMYEIGFRISSAVGGALSGIKSVGSAITELNQKVERTNAKAAHFGEKQGQFGGQFAKETAVVGAAATAMIYPAMQFEKSMASVRKTVDFIDDADFKKFSDDLLGMTQYLPMSADGLANIAASAGQAGVAKEDILEFTETIAKMGVAFDVSAEQAGDMAVKLANVYKIPTSKFSEIGDAINSLSSNSPAKAEEIIQGMIGFGGGAQGFGISADEAAAFTSVGISMGKDASTVSTAFNNFFRSLNTMDNQSKDFHEALNKVGLSADAIREGKIKDPAQAMVDIFGQLSNYDTDTRESVLASLFGANDGSALFSSMSQNMPLLQAQLALVRDINQEGKKSYVGSMEKEFQTMAQTTFGELQILKNNFFEVGIIIGSTLLPPIKDLVNDIKPVIQGFAAWAKENPELVEGGLKVAGVVIGLRLGFLALNFAVFGVISKVFTFIASIQKAVGIAKIAIPAVITFGKVLGGILLTSLNLVGNALLWIGRAMLLNPIGLAITIIAIPFLIFKYWEPIKGFFQDLWMNLKRFFSSGIGNISKTILNWSPIGLFYKVFASVLNWFGAELPMDFTAFGSMVIDGFISGAKSIWEGTKQFFDDVITYLRDPFDALPMEMQTFGVDIIEGLVGGAKAIWDNTKGFFTGVVSFIKNPFNTLPTEMQTFGVDVIDGFVGGSKAIWEGAKEFFTGIVDFIKNPFGVLIPEMQVIGGDIINNLLGGAQSLWEGAKTFFSDVAGFIQDPFGTIGETFSGYGENIMDGIVGGVSSKLSAAKETITNVGNSIKGWFTSVLGIHSPSRVFMGYGENITEGAAIGIEQGLPDAKKAIDKLSDEMQLTPSLLSSKSGSGSFDVSYSKPQQDSGNTITITFSPTINANDVTGVKEALKLSQSELEKMINEILRKRERRSYA